MVAHIVTCPYFHKAAPVLRHVKNRRGSARYRCKDCDRTFTLEPNPRLLTPDKEQRILDALSERLSIEAVVIVFSALMPWVSGWSRTHFAPLSPRQL